MSQNKTVPTDGDVVAFLNLVEPQKKREDSFAILELIQQVTGEQPVMWGDSIIGFGRYHYRYSSGREGEWLLVGFSPRKQAITLYIMAGFDDYADLLQKLGKYKTGKSCLYIKKIEDINLDILRELVRQSVAHIKETNTVE
ncbi:MAG: DUF1801 domain-containing protein [Chloroflexi bacterium]|nr:MAG: DUF1801 domain-containing protein [Chloroflexota bacterium]